MVNLFLNTLPEPVSWNKVYINTNTDVKVLIPMIGRELDLFIVLERNQEPYWFLHSNRVRDIFITTNEKKL